MKHYQKGRKFRRPAKQRKALLKNLAASLILKEKITTTEAKAKELRPFVEKLITRSRPTEVGSGAAAFDGEEKSSPKKVSSENNLAAIRYLARYLPVEARQKLVSQLGPGYQKRAGGYTRIIKLGRRRTDGAEMALIELVK